MRQTWLKLTAPLPAPAARKHRLGERLIARYETRGRHYHNTAHIKAMLRLCRRYQHELAEPNAVRWAILFHDAVYVSRRPDNEARSAEYAARVLQALGSPPQPQVTALILATQQHRLDSMPRPWQADAQWFLDFDLAILASPVAAYARYAEAIRREYAWVNERAYRQGRARVLRSFLDERPSVYFTPLLREQWEARARRNLAAELRRLGTPPG